MTIVFNGTEPYGDITDYIRRVETLLTHLRKLKAGDLPTRHELERAPVLDNYQPGIRPADCLIGVVVGHPTLSGGMTTSEIWTFAPHLGWAHTISRLYRLGRPATISDTRQ